MNCECNTCKDCGSAPKVSGTEVTILSGTQSARQNGVRENPVSGAHYVLGAAVIVSVIAFFTTRNKNSE